ncbi:MAG: septation protein SpoVG family protein [Ignavibacteriales bacterium]|nr:septation protein SpoVG family protein [Ignavibacteriales bacterium]
MHIESMNRSAGSSKIKAYFDVVTDEGIIIKGFKIAEGAKGLFVGVPSDQDRKDKTKYWDRVLIPKESKNELTQAALAEYGKLGGSNETEIIMPDFDVPAPEMPF